MKTKAKIPSSAISSVTTPTEEQLMTRAYEIWENEGHPEGRALDHWLEAHRQLRVTPIVIDPAQRLTADALDPAASEAGKLENRLESLVSSGQPRSATSL